MDGHVYEVPAERKMKMTPQMKILRKKKMKMKMKMKIS